MRQSQQHAAERHHHGVHGIVVMQWAKRTRPHQRQTRQQQRPCAKNTVAAPAEGERGDAQQRREHDEGLIHIHPTTEFQTERRRQRQ
jgi:hypothetical protein